MGVGEAVVQWVGLSFSESVPLDSELHKCSSGFTSHPLAGIGWLRWAGAGYFPSRGRWGSDGTWVGEALVNQVPLRAGLVKNKVPRGVLEWFPFPSPCRSPKGFFSSIYSGNLIELLGVNLHNTVRAPPWLGPFGIFNSQMCLHWDFSNSVITVQIFLPWNCLPQWFLLVSLGSLKPNALYSPVSPILEALVWPANCCLSYRSRKIIDLKYLQFFYLLRESGSFQVAIMRN